MHACLHLQITPVYNFKSIHCLKTLEGVYYTILLPDIEAKPQNCLRQKCCNFAKNNICIFKKSHAHFQYAYSISAKFQIDCLKTLGRVDNINLLPYNEANW